MKDLIIIVIAIALSAIVTATGIYYAGTGFMANEARASAAKYVNYLNQMDSILSLWSQRNGGNLPSPGTNYPAACSNAAYCNINELQSMMGSRYIGIPSTPDGADGTELYYWDENGMQNPVLLLRLGVSSVAQATCLAVETARQGGIQSSSLRIYGAGKSSINSTMCGTSGCFQNDGTFGDTNTYLYVIYSRVRQMPNSSIEDFPGPICPTS